MTVATPDRLLLPLHEERARLLLAALHDRDGRSAAARVVHDLMLLRAMHTKPGR